MYTALTDIGVYQVVKDAFRRAKLTKPVYPHMLRHSWMTEMLRRGMNPIQLSIIAGRRWRSSMGTTRTSIRAMPTTR